jgi:hypothetical protein
MGGCQADLTLALWGTFWYRFLYCSSLNTCY